MRTHNHVSTYNSLGKSFETELVTLREESLALVYEGMF